MKTLFIGISWLLLMSNLAYGQAQAQKSWKVGMNRFTSGIAYTYATQIAATEGGTVDQDISKKSEGSIATTDFMVEKIFAGRLGLEFNFNITPGIRNFSFEDSNNTKIGDIVEESKSSLLYGLNLYFSDHTSDGIKVFFGVLTGSMEVKHSFSNGGDRDDDEDDVLAGYKATQSSTKALPIQMFKLGFDWIFDTVGLRVQFTSLSGETKTSESLGETELEQNQDETVTMSGGAGIGVFGHF